jgi:hypothetical protein
MKEVKDLYNENYKTLKKKINEDIRRRKDFLFMDQQNQCCENGYYQKQFVCLMKSLTKFQ